MLTRPQIWKQICGAFLFLPQTVNIAISSCFNIFSFQTKFRFWCIPHLQMLSINNTVHNHFNPLDIMRFFHWMRNTSHFHQNFSFFFLHHRKLKIVAGEQLALTPPMGWNHWYAHYDRITDKMMREAADVMISSGMADVGYQYVNIDDCWMNAEKNSDPLRVGPLRDDKGNVIPNKHFPDMKGLTTYIHTKGLKAGIYTSPGPRTCGRRRKYTVHPE